MVLFNTTFLPMLKMLSLASVVDVFHDTPFERLYTEMTALTEAVISIKKVLKH